MVAALEQAEQLARAAGAIGPAAQPLPLFYALTQAGRAITAVHLKEHWETSAHGLSWPGPSRPGDLLQRKVEPQPSNSATFDRVAAATHSAPLTAPVALGAVWAALPELALPTVPNRQPSWHPALRVLPYDPPHHGVVRLLTMTVEALVVGLNDISTSQAIIDQLQHYPSARAGTPDLIPFDDERRVVIGSTGSPEECAPVVVWRTPDANASARRATLDEVAPPYQSHSTRTAIPQLPTGDWLSPLMLWWVLLFGLSNLARYEPAAWAAALDVNSSPLAVPLEAAMQEALTSLPHLVLEALLGTFVERHSY